MTDAQSTLKASEASARAVKGLRLVLDRAYRMGKSKVWVHAYRFYDAAGYPIHPWNLPKLRTSPCSYELEAFRPLVEAA